MNYRLVYCTYGLLCACLAVGQAQQQPTVSSRQNLVDALNAAVAVSQAQLSFNNSGNGIHQYDALGGSCDLVNPLVIDFMYPSGEDYFIIKRKLTDAGFLSGELAHPLVEDLNTWINNVWARELEPSTSEESGGAFSWECDGVQDQRFFTRVTTDQNAIEYLKDVTGEQAMLDRYYLINGVEYQGNQILRFWPAGTTRHVRYITDLGSDLQDASDNRRMLSEAYLEILCPDGMGGLTTALTFKFQLQTASYGAGDCSDHVAGDDEVLMWVNGLVRCTNGTEIVGTGTAAAQNENLWTWYDGKRDMWQESTDDYTKEGHAFPDGVPQLGWFSLSTSGELRFELYYDGDICLYSDFLLCVVTEQSFDAEYCEVALCNDGQFALDPVSKALVFVPTSPAICGGCSSQPIPCIVFCDEAAPAVVETPYVISASARRFSDRSPLIDTDVFPVFNFSTIYSPKNPGIIAYENKNSFELGSRGKWRITEEYVFSSQIQPGSGLFTDGNPLTERNYNDAGVFTLKMFDWSISEEDLPEEWVNATTITRYSYNGEPIEERDAFGIPSTAQFGYAQQVPVLVASNAEFAAAQFVAFEDGTRYLEAGEGPIVEGPAHSGRYSLAVPSAGWSDVIVPEYTLGPDQLQDKVLIRFWVKQTYTTLPVQADGECPMRIRFDKNGTPLFEIGYPDITFVAQTGAWSLYEAILDGSTVVLGGPDSYDVRVKNDISEVTVWLDDFRIQPFESEMVGYVYDPDNLRPIAIFDDQHFGIYYQYNAEGKLIRENHETERGIRTVKESQYHTPLIDRAGVVSSGTSSSGGFPEAAVQSSRALLDGVGRVDMPSVDTKDGNEFEILDVELGLHRQDLKIFGLSVEELRDRADEFEEILSHPSLTTLEMPELEKLTLIENLSRVDADLDQLTALEAEAGLNDSVRASLRESIREATQVRSEIMQRLGVSEAAAREIIRAARDARSSSGDEELGEDVETEAE